MILAMIPKAELDLMFHGDKQAIEEYGDYLVSQEELLSEGDGDIYYNSIYEEKLEKLKNKESKSFCDAIINMIDIDNMERKIKKNDKMKKIYRKKDLSIATYLNSDKYKKKFLDKNQYRKALKKLAKSEKEEEKEMIRLGYIRKGNPDEELKKLQKANEKITNALSDAYTQKYFLD